MTETRTLHVYTVDYPYGLAGPCPSIVAHYSAREAEELVQRTDESDAAPHADLLEPADYARIEILDEDGDPVTLADSLRAVPLTHPCIIADGEE